MNENILLLIIATLFILILLKFIKPKKRKKMTQVSAQQLYQELINDNIINSTGKINLTLNFISVQIETKDSIGHMLQDWLKEWAHLKGFYLRANQFTQEFPDFYLSTSNEDNLLEVKSFDYTASPNFDISNFDTYVRSLINFPKKLDADYLVFGYSLNSGVLKIEGLWLKKIWELTTCSNDWALRLQVKQNVIHNIRPVNFVSTRQNIAQPFSNKLDFLNAIQDVLNNYSNTSSSHRNWLQDFKTNYRNSTGISL